MANTNYERTDYLTWGTYPRPGLGEPDEPEYYIYFYHVDDPRSDVGGTYIILPTYPDSVSDQQLVSYSSELPLGRSAPLQSYGGSGPRAIQFNFILHRDMMWLLNQNNISIPVSIDDDYVDLMARKILGAALPEYAVADKMVSPPMVAVKIGNEIFIKGVVTGSVGVVYKPPVLRNGKFATVEIGFSVTEVVPYSASKAMELGSYRDASYDLMTSEVYTVGSDPGSSTVHTGSSRLLHSGSGRAF